MLTWSNAFSQRSSMPELALKARARLLPMFHCGNFLLSNPSFLPLTSPMHCSLSPFLSFSSFKAWDCPAQIGRGFFNLHSACIATASVFLCCDESVGGELTPFVRHLVYMYIHVYIYTHRVSWYFLIKYSLKLKMKLNRRQCFFAGSATSVSRFHP